MLHVKTFQLKILFHEIKVEKSKTWIHYESLNIFKSCVTLCSLSLDIHKVHKATSLGNVMNFVVWHLAGNNMWHLCALGSNRKIKQDIETDDPRCL